jgi:hypothetical protein
MTFGSAPSDIQNHASLNAAGCRLAGLVARTETAQLLGEALACAQGRPESAAVRRKRGVASHSYCGAARRVYCCPRATEVAQSTAASVSVRLSDTSVPEAFQAVPKAFPRRSGTRVRSDFDPDRPGGTPWNACSAHSDASGKACASIRWRWC